MVISKLPQFVYTVFLKGEATPGSLADNNGNISNNCLKMFGEQVALKNKIFRLSIILCF